MPASGLPRPSWPNLPEHAQQQAPADPVWGTASPQGHGHEQRAPPKSSRPQPPELRPSSQRHESRPPPATASPPTSACAPAMAPPSPRRALAPLAQLPPAPAGPSSPPSPAPAKAPAPQAAAATAGSITADSPGAEHAGASGPAQHGPVPGLEPGLGSEPGARAQARVPSERLRQLKTEDELAHYDWMTQNVPRTQGEAVALFFSRPAILGIVITLATLACLRLGPGAPALGLADGLVLVAVALWWVLQEWIIHARLLHSAIPWWGRKIHETHHALPYHHVSIDGFKVVLPTMLLAYAAMRLLFQSRGMFLTALSGYYGMGLAYEWTHFLVHTRVPMQTLLGRVIKRAHVKHHLRDQRFWFSFTCPPLDNLMGTTPDAWTVA